MRISDWSSDVCSSDLVRAHEHVLDVERALLVIEVRDDALEQTFVLFRLVAVEVRLEPEFFGDFRPVHRIGVLGAAPGAFGIGVVDQRTVNAELGGIRLLLVVGRSEEPTSELQSLMRTSYAVFSLEKKH